MQSIQLDSDPQTPQSVPDAMSSRKAKRQLSMTGSPLVQAQAGNAPVTPDELRVANGAFVAEGDDVAVVRVADDLELLDRQVQEAHEETANGQAVGDDQHALGVLPQDLAHHSFEEAGGAVEAVGGALPAG